MPWHFATVFWMPWHLARVVPWHSAVLLVVLQYFPSSCRVQQHFSLVPQHSAAFFLCAVAFCYSFRHAAAFGNIFLHAAVFGGHCALCHSTWRHCASCQSNWSNQLTSTTMGNGGICFQKKCSWLQDSGDFPLQKIQSNIIVLQKKTINLCGSGLAASFQLNCCQCCHCPLVLGIFRLHSSFCRSVQPRCGSCCGIRLCHLLSCSVFLLAAEGSEVLIMFNVML